MPLTLTPAPAARGLPRSRVLRLDEVREMEKDDPHDFKEALVLLVASGVFEAELCLGSIRYRKVKELPRDGCFPRA